MQSGRAATVPHPLLMPWAYILIFLDYITTPSSTDHCHSGIFISSSSSIVIINIMSYIMESVAAAAASPPAAYPPSEDLPDLMGMVKFAAQVLFSGKRDTALLDALQTCREELEAAESHSEIRHVS